VTDAVGQLTEPVVRNVVEPVRAQVTQPLVEHVVENVVEPVREHVTEPLIERVIEPVVTPIVDPLVPVVVPVTGPVDVAPVQPTVLSSDAVAPTVGADGPASSTPPTPSTPSTAPAADDAPDTVQPVITETPGPLTPAPAPLPAPLPATLPASTGTAGSSSAGSDGATAVPADSTATPVPAAMRAPVDIGRHPAVNAVIDPSFSPD
jgi:hypothetical protein